MVGRIAGAIRDITYVGYAKSPFPTQACLQVGKRTWDTPKHEEEVGQGPHEFRMVGRIAGAIRDITYVGYAKSPFPTQACLQVGKRTWDTPKHEEEVGQGPHEFRMVGRIAGAIRDITFGGHIVKCSKLPGR